MYHNPKIELCHPRVNMHEMSSRRRLAKNSRTDGNLRFAGWPDKKNALENIYCSSRFNSRIFLSFSEFPSATCFYVDLSFLIKQLILDQKETRVHIYIIVSFESKANCKFVLSLSLFFVYAHVKRCVFSGINLINVINKFNRERFILRKLLRLRIKV